MQRRTPKEEMQPGDEDGPASGEEGPAEDALTDDDDPPSEEEVANGKEEQDSNGSRLTAAPGDPVCAVAFDREL